MGKKGKKRKKASNQPTPDRSASSKAPLGEAQSSKNDLGSGKTVSAGRVVITHSTYLPKLIHTLEKLVKYPRIKTITPAVISRVRSNSHTFKLKVSVPITGGYKLIARHRKSAQEVFVVTDLSKAELESAIAQVLS
ncbi:MAG: DUF2103 domain-containing protein [Phormidesmis sp.]